MVDLLTNATRIASRIIIAVFALVAIMMAVYVGLAIVQQPGHGRMWMILRASSIAAMFVVMAFAMVSYLVKKLGAKKVP
jgi:hypothetical protein